MQALEMRLLDEIWNARIATWAKTEAMRPGNDLSMSAKP